jgi:hypothetical protein
LLHLQKNEGVLLIPHIGAPADAVAVLAIGAVNSSETRLLSVQLGPLMTEEE